MTIDVNSVTISKQGIVEITGQDLESFLTVKHLQDEQAEADTVTFRFDIEGSQGARIYLYKILKSNKKAQEKSTWEDKIMALEGQVIFISGNFLAKAEG